MARHYVFVEDSVFALSVQGDQFTLVELPEGGEQFTIWVGDVASCGVQWQDPSAAQDFVRWLVNWEVGKVADYNPSFCSYRVNLQDQVVTMGLATE